MYRLFSGVRQRLILIVIAAITGLTFGLHFQVKLYLVNETESIESQVLAAARIIAMQLRMHIERVEPTLAALAIDPVIAAGIPSDCTDRLAQADATLKRFGYTRFALINSDGIFYCAGTTIDEPSGQQNKRFYRSIVDNRRFGLGDLEVGILASDSVIVAAYPIVDEDNSVKNIVTTGIAQTWLESLLREVSDRIKAEIRLVDAEGIIVAQHPVDDSESFLSIAGTKLFRAIQQRHEGTVEVESSEGYIEILGFAIIDQNIGDLFVTVNLPAPDITDWWANDISQLYLFMLALISLTVIGVCLSVDHTILRGMRRIAGVSRLLAEGDLSARVGLDRSSGEFGELAGHFDDMASALEKRDRQTTRDTIRLVNANKDLEHFAYIASHDLRAPLRGIDNLVQWIEEDIEDVLTDESRYNMERLRQRVDRLDQLMDALLRYSRAGRIQEDQSVVDTKELLIEVVGLLDPPSGFMVQIGDNMPVILTTKAAIQTVFLNLIGNALKHHDREQGEIRVKGRHVLDGIVEFTVSDDGPGIPDYARERIFDIFQTLDQGDGKSVSGIGLAIVKRLVESHSGSVTVTPTENGSRGAIFRFTWTAPAALSRQCKNCRP